MSLFIISFSFQIEKQRVIHFLNYKYALYQRELADF